MTKKKKKPIIFKITIHFLTFWFMRVDGHQGAVACSQGFGPQAHFTLMKVWLTHDLSLGRESQEMIPKYNPYPLVLMQY